MGILKSTNSGKHYTYISKENLLRLGWIREKSSSGRDLFYEPGSYHPFQKGFRYLEYKSMENPKWFLLNHINPGYFDEGFYIEMFDMEYLVKTIDDLKLCNEFWNTFSSKDIHKAMGERLNIKDQILICNEWNIKRYDPHLEYYKSRH